MNEYEREREDSLIMESMSEGEYMYMYEQQAANRAPPTEEWILTDFDTWVKNPNYRGPIGPHPEDDSFHSMTSEEQAEMIKFWNTPREVPVMNYDLEKDIPF